MKHLSLQLVLFVFLVWTNISARTIQIGYGTELEDLNTATDAVISGDTVVIMPGKYDNVPQMTWRQDNILITGQENITELVAGTIIASDQSNGKGIFVIKGNNIRIQNLIFKNSKVKDHNGAGIRLEGKNPVIINCEFIGNEMGILQGGTIEDCTTTIEHCLFSGNGSAEHPGFQHNVYINYVDTLIFRFNTTIDAAYQGHELKSRAENNFILYNQIHNTNSEDSRNIDLPNGGKSVVMGNTIVQSENSVNSNIIGYGAEGTKYEENRLWVLFNTIINKKSKGSIIDARECDSLYLANNIIQGRQTGGFIIGKPETIDSAGNLVSTEILEEWFGNIDNNDYSLTPKSPAIDNAVQIEYGLPDFNFKPRFSLLGYKNIELRLIDGNGYDIGAMEYKHINSNVSDNHQRDLFFEKDYVYFPTASDNECLGLYGYSGKQLEIPNPDIISVDGSFYYELPVSRLNRGVFYFVTRTRTFMFTR